jgi:small-conductance mechanosensitive channel
VSITSLLRAEMAAAMGAALALGVLLLALRPGDRASTRNALILLGLCALAELADSSIASLAGSRPAAIVADVASVLVGVVLIRLATIFFFRVLLPAVRLRPLRMAEDLTTAGLYVGWGFVWLRMAGVDLGSLVATSAVITAVLAFAMQDTLGNVLGGLVLQLDRSVRVGDWMRVEQVNGRVVEIGWRHTAIQTRDRETVIVPNGWLVKNRFSVIGARGDPMPVWRRWVRVNVDLSASPGEACRVLEEAVRNARIPLVSPEPAPDAVLLELTPRYGSYAIRYWLEDPAHDDPTDSRVREHIVAALARHGMRIGAAYTEQLNLEDDEAHRSAERGRERSRRLEALARVELFAMLSKEERESLVEHLVRAPFAVGDVITRQGAVAHWLYLMVRGEAEVWFEQAGQRTAVGTLGPGSVFGEMGMMTGAPRGATVTARTDVDAYRLDKDGFAQIIQARPDLAREMSRVLAARAADLRAKTEAAAHAAHGEDHGDILEKVRRFFGLD